MKHSEKEIKDKAKIILDDAGRNYDFKIIKALFLSDDLMISGQYKGKKIPAWTVVIHSTFLFEETSDFLMINDEDGEPLYLQTKHGPYVIKKVNGVYAFED
jgi:hypothetical protein